MNQLLLCAKRIYRSNHILTSKTAFLNLGYTDAGTKRDMNVSPSSLEYVDFLIIAR